MELLSDLAMLSRHSRLHRKNPKTIAIKKESLSHNQDNEFVAIVCRIKNFFLRCDN